MNKQQKKQDYINYFCNVPIQRYAAMFVGRDEDTIIRWKNEDKEFADAIQRAKAEWVRKKLIATKAEFALERLEKEIFSANSNILINNFNPINVEPGGEYDPFTKENKSLVTRMTEFLMEETKAK